MCVDTTCSRAVILGYDAILAKDAHSTWNSGHLTTDQIIEHHNNVLKWFAETAESADIYSDLINFSSLFPLYILCS